jgi:hypothetical protein
MALSPFVLYLRELRRRFKLVLSGLALSNGRATRQARCVGRATSLKIDR